MTAAAVEHWSALSDRLGASLPGAAVPWVTNARARARQRFNTVGFPGPGNEDWKYTSVAPILRAGLELPTATGAREAAAAIAALSLPPPARLVAFVDGKFAPELSMVGTLPRGVRVQSLAALLAAGDSSLQEAFSAQLDAADGFTALNRALAADGAVVTLDPEATMDDPLHLLFYASSGGQVLSCFNLIRAGEGARATVVEHVAGADGARLTTAVTRLDLAARAAVDYHKLQEEAPQAFHVATIEATQQAGSRLGAHSYAFGAALSRTTIRTAFAGRGCDAELNGLYLIGGRQHADHHTTIDHAQPDGTSREFYKGIVDGRARAVFNGRVLVRPDAQRTDARQVNRNLLLSEHAEIDTKPQLEIYADDVKCSHGATIGQLDEAQLFYLRARGVDADAARSLLTYGFAEDLIGRVACTPLKVRLEDLLLSRLPQGNLIRELL